MHQERRKDEQIGLQVSEHKDETIKRRNKRNQIQKTQKINIAKPAP
jgi:hypothetical protein